MDKKFKKQNMLKFVGYGFFALIVVAILCVRFLYGSVIAVSGSSMVPTFQDTDYVFATILQDDDELNVGDIVILEQDGVYLIKRVYGLPGQTIQPDYVKGIPELTLGEDEYYVVGDNWRVSRDSRAFGPVSRSELAFKYADMHWTRWGMIISLLVPAVLFIAQLSIVFIPADKNKKKRENEEELIDETPTATGDDDAELPILEEVEMSDVSSENKSDIPAETVQTESTPVN